jgi:sugar phosphate isomerase/epimerase
MPLSSRLFCERPKRSRGRDRAAEQPIEPRRHHKSGSPLHESGEHPGSAPSSLSRREFVAAACAIPYVGAVRERAVRLGGPIFLKSDDPAELAREHRRWGYSAAYCPAAALNDRDRIQAIKTAYAAEHVVIAEVGAWRNLLDPDTQKRADNLHYVTERLALADAVEARCCVDIAGSFNPTVWYGPDPKNLSRDFFDATVENCRKVIDAVKPRATKFSIEMMAWSLPDGPDTYLELIRAVDRPAFAVHMDVCNGINSPARFYRNDRFIVECFEKLGQWIVSCHAKDLEWIPEYAMRFREVVPGRGKMDYATYLRELSRLPVDAPLMLEHLQTPEEYTEGRDYIRSVGARTGITFV